jgi:hypothetical protein
VSAVRTFQDRQACSASISEKLAPCYRLDPAILSGTAALAQPRGFADRAITGDASADKFLAAVIDRHDAVRLASAHDQLSTLPAEIAMALGVSRMSVWRALK